MAGVFGTEIWKNWEKSGKQEFIKTCIPFLKDENKSPMFDKHGKTSNITYYINELVEKGIKGVLRKESVVATLQELVTMHSDMPSIILDVLNLTDAITSQNDGEDSKDRNNFSAIIKECEKFLSDKLLKERLEIDTLQEVGVLKNNTFYSKFIKVKTKLYYKQRKFNLFREECEGFAKLVTELNGDFSENTDPTELISIVQSLIGCFNLDPNRVLDVILESFENKQKDARIFVPLINSYMNDPQIISEVLSTKFSFLKNNEQEVPQSLYVLTAQLIQHKIIQLDDIYHWLYPDDKVMMKECEKNMKDAKEYARKLQIINLNNKDKENSPEEVENYNENYVGNQKLGLCEALLLVGDWENAKLLMKRLPEQYAVGYEPIAMALSSLIHHIIEPVYQRHGIISDKIPRTPIPGRELLPSSPPQARTFHDLKSFAVPMLLQLGASLRFDPVLLCKIVRLAKAALASYGVEGAKSEPPAGESLYYDILSLLDETVLPSLSYLECNCCVAEEVWTLLKLYPYQVRYALYSRWKNDTYNANADLVRKRADSEKQIKSIMKRVSKENVKPVGRLIGKLTHCSPGFLFDYVLLQIQVYNNLIVPVVDSLKYLTNLSYDVLGYCLIESLANAEKKRVKHDSTSISTWLQSLASFCGAVYKKYTIELTGLLQFVANQLKAQKSLDLLILKEVVQKMAGVDAAEDLTMEQLNALSGGELLKSEAGYFSQVRNTKKSSSRLKESMAENDLAVALCLLMAQQNYCVVYKETQKSHMKLVGKLSDQCQDTLVQFGTFLGSTMSVDEYVDKLPSIQSMLLDYHIPLEVAFFLARPMFNHATNQKYDQLRKSDPNYKKMSSSLKNQKYSEAVAEIMQEVHTSLIPLHPPRVWEDITPQFLSTFWSLTMYDLHVPEDTYHQVINKAKAQALANPDSGAKGKKERERYQTLFEKLQGEKRKHGEHVEKIVHRLRQEKDSWFPSRAPKAAKNEAITRFLQLCIFPRCTFTQVDAVYCAKFVYTIHLLKTPNFSTLLFYDRLFCDVTCSITSCTENEAMRYGRFLFSLLETVSEWHRSKDTFHKECMNYPGFVTKYRKNNQQADNLDNVDYENYRHVCHKWHFKLAKAMVTCLESKLYVQIRNALIVLIKIIPHYPVLVKLSQFIEKRIEKVRDEEKNNRQDLFTLSSSYLGLLKQKNASGQMMKESDFHIPLEKEKVKSSETKPDANNKANGNAKNTTPSKPPNNPVGSKTVLEDQPKDKRASKQTPEETRTVTKTVTASHTDTTNSNNKDKTEKVHKEEQPREVYKSDKKDEPEKDRDREKRRERRDEKGSSNKEERYNRNSKHDERKMAEFFADKVDKRDRSAKAKEERDEMTDEEKEIRKERKLGRKRDRLEEADQLEMKRRREEDKMIKMSPNGELILEPLVIPREKHHRTREISPYPRERSHEKSEPRDKHRRSSENKRR